LASCAHIDQLIQSYLDQELPHADRVILEQHVAECAACAELLRRQQRATAFMFESFSPAQLTQDLTDYVLSHLPEMERPQLDVVGLNRRAKNATGLRERIFRLVPLAAAVLLVILAAVINTRWPEGTIPVGAMGMIAYADGDFFRAEAGTNSTRSTSAKTPAMSDDRFITGADGHASLLLMGPSEIRMDSDTRLRVDNDRQITLESGRIVLDVAKSSRWFKVFTPVGEVTVFGTRFEVLADSSRTTVTVEQGEVQLTHRDNPQMFRSVKPNQRAYVESGLDAVPMQYADARADLAWADAVVAPDPMREYFATHVQPANLVTEVQAESVFLIKGDGPLISVVLAWEDTSPFVRYCDYEVFVSASNGDPYFRAHIDGAVFQDPRINKYEIPNTGGARTAIDTVFVKLVPVMNPAARQVTFTSLSGTFGKGGR
jgi:hypothetical protein